jgi:hypothetical protein
MAGFFMRVRQIKYGKGKTGNSITFVLYPRWIYSRPSVSTFRNPIVRIITINRTRIVSTVLKLTYYSAIKYYLYLERHVSIPKGVIFRILLFIKYKQKLC